MSSSRPPAVSPSVDASAAKYRPVTRDLLLGLCRKQFVLKVVQPHASGGLAPRGADIKSSTMRSLAAHNGEESVGFQSRMETLEQYLKRATHLQLDHLKLTHTFPVAEMAIANGQSPLDTAFSSATKMRVLYLHDNHLSTLDAFDFCRGALSHLYLQNNNIARMTNLLQLTRLEKLYIGGNQIQLLEGFAKEDVEPSAQTAATQDGSHPPFPSPQPFDLVELHMDGQRLPPNVSLQLSVPSIQALSSSLTILTLSSNQMDSDAILPISLLSQLTQLDLSHNRIDDLRLLAEMCGYLDQLHQLDLRDNPVNAGPAVTAVTHKKYRDRIIMSSREIVLLDDKAVPDNQREYLHSLAAQKRLKRAQSAAARGQPKELTPEEQRFAALHAPPQFPYQQKVLTLRSAPAAGGASINAAQIGGMGVSASHTFQSTGSIAAYPASGHRRGPSVSYAAEPSPFFDDDDPNLGGSGGGGDSEFAFSAAPASSRMAYPSSLPGEEPHGDRARLDNLLQTRGLVSAFGQTSLGESAGADSARNRRASMNALNQTQTGWDGGRTPHLPVIPGATGHSRSGSSTASAGRARANMHARNNSGFGSGK